jgi:hypothetical protein
MDQQICFSLSWIWPRSTIEFPGHKSMSATCAESIGFVRRSMRGRRSARSAARAPAQLAYDFSEPCRRFELPDDTRQRGALPPVLGNAVQPTERCRARRAAAQGNGIGWRR